MGGEWLICDVTWNDYICMNDHNFVPTLSPHVSLFLSFLDKQKRQPPEANSLSLTSLDVVFCSPP